MLRLWGCKFHILTPSALGDCYKDCLPCAWSCSHTPSVDTITCLLPDSLLSAAKCKSCSNYDTDLTPSNSYFVANHQSCIPCAQCCHQIERIGRSNQLLKLSCGVKPNTESLGSVNAEAKLKWSHLETLILCVQQRGFEGKYRIVQIVQCVLDPSIESSQWCKEAHWREQAHATCSCQSLFPAFYFFPFCPHSFCFPVQQVLSLCNFMAVVIIADREVDSAWLFNGE